jgi:hypothetical protein
LFANSEMKNEFYFVLKVRGLKEEKDFLQIRNEKFMLLANLRWSKPYESIEKFFGVGEKSQKIIAIAQEIPYGKLTKIEV